MTTANGHALFLGPARTAGYRPSVYQASPSYFTGQVGLWSLAEVEEMRRDPRVRFGLSVVRGPLAAVEFDVKARRPEVAAYVSAQIRRFWERDLQKALRMVEYGWAAGECLYRLENDLIQWDELADVHPRDVTPLTRSRTVAGVRVATGGAPTDLYPPRAFWVAHEPEFGSPYGRSRLANCWAPWKEKTNRHGAVDSRRVWYVKNAFRGGTIRHPDGRIELEEGSSISCQDYARQLLEQMETGGILVLPNARDPQTGEYLWVYEPPAGHGTAGLDVREYIVDLNLELLEGLDVPPEVVQAAETGSGWSGRSVPMLVFLAGEDALAQAVLRAFDRCALKHLVRVNYGDEPYTVAPVPLAETLMGGGEGGQPQPGAPQPGGNGGAGGGQWVPYQGARGGRGGRNADTGAVRYLSLSGGPGPVIDPAVRERVIRRIEAAEG